MYASFPINFTQNDWLNPNSSDPVYKVYVPVGWSGFIGVYFKIYWKINSFTGHTVDEE